MMSILEDLRGRLSATRTAADGIMERMRGVALGAAKGDVVAVKAAEKLNADRRRAEDDAALLVLAIEQAEAEEQAKADRVAAEREAARLAEIERVSAEVVAAATVVDDAARMLCGALARRREALRRLPRLGVNTSHVNRLDRSETLARSLRCHGLTDYLDLPAAAGVPHSSLRPLADIDRNLLVVPH